MRAVWLATYFVSLGLSIYEDSVVMTIYSTLRQQLLSNRLLQFLQENNWTAVNSSIWVKSGRSIRVEPEVWIYTDEDSGSMYVLKRRLLQYQKNHGLWTWNKRIECCIEDMYDALLSQACG